MTKDDSWNLKFLSELTDKIGSGATPRGGSNAYHATGTTLIRSQNVLDYEFSNQGLAFINDQQAAELSSVEVKSNDILLNITGDSVARCCIVPDRVLPARVNQHVAIVRVNEKKADRKFIFYCLQNLKEELLLQSEIGATRRALTKGMIENLQILIPSLPQQKSIASILSSLDDKIDLLYRQNKTLEAMAETLFRQWFDQCDGTEGQLGDEFEFIMGQSPTGDSFNDVGEGMPMFQGNADFGFRFPKERIYTIKPTRQAKKFDTLISVRAPVGDQNMALADCCIGRGLAAFRCRLNNDFYTYTYYKLRSLMKEIKKFDDEGTVFGSIGKNDFQSMGIILPIPQKIFGFEEAVKPINDKIINNCIAVDKLINLKEILLPKLMSGEVGISH